MLSHNPSRVGPRCEEPVARLAGQATAPCYIAAAQAFDRFGFDQDGRLRAAIARHKARGTG